jgi:hypothetical protein
MPFWEKPLVMRVGRAFRIGPAIFALLLACPLVFAAVAWLGLPVSNQELLANFSKAENFYRGILSESGFPWWSPYYLQGTSLAFAWVFMATNATLLCFSIPFGFLARIRPAPLSGSLTLFPPANL